jgi:hypothetical protein
MSHDARWTVGPWQQVFNLLNPVCCMDKLQTCPHSGIAAEMRQRRARHSTIVRGARGASSGSVGTVQIT